MERYRAIRRSTLAIVTAAGRRADPVSESCDQHNKWAHDKQDRARGRVRQLTFRS